MTYVSLNYFYRSVYLSTGWFKERIRAWFHNQTWLNWTPYGK